MEQNDLPIEVVLRKIGECPVCHKGQMTQGTAGWTCDYFQSLQDKCTFTIFRSYDGYVLHEEDAVQLITVGETDYKPFVTLSGKEFTARLKRVGDKIKVVGDNAVLGLPCPVCGRKVKELQNGYACEGFFKEDVEHCNLYIPKTICERPITKDEAEDLLENISTEVLDGFIANGKQFSSCLKIGPDGFTAAAVDGSDQAAVEHTGDDTDSQADQNTQDVIDTGVDSQDGEHAGHGHDRAYGQVIATRHDTHGHTAGYDAVNGNLTENVDHVAPGEELGLDQAGDDDQNDDTNQDAVAQRQIDQFIFV